MVDRKLADPEYARRHLERQDSTVAAQNLKAVLRAEGYRYHLSIYGVAHDFAALGNVYRRMEVLTKKFWTGYDVTYVKGFFEFIIPAQAYTMWTYDREGPLLKCRGGFH